MTASVRSVGLARLAVVFAILIAAHTAALAMPATAHAAGSYYVSMVGSDTIGNGGSRANPFASVQKAVNVAAANGGGAVIVGPGTFRGDVDMTTGVSLYGTGPSCTILRGSGTRSVVIATDVGSPVTISGFTITGGRSAAGGGIYCQHSSPAIVNDTITSNIATGWGGGIDCTASSNPTILDDTISSNTVSASAPTWGLGGGIYCDHSSPWITNSTFFANAVTSGFDPAGCAICICFSSSPTVQGNIIIGNSGTKDACGGGICVYAACAPTIERNTITANTGGYGAGIYSEQCTPTIAGNTIEGNNALADGGGIELNHAAAPTITGNTITGNSAPVGGGIYSNFSTSTISSDLIMSNAATTHGGGIYLTNSKPSSITNSVIAGNSATLGGGIYSWASTPTVTNDTVTGNSDGIYSLFATSTVTNCIVWGNGTTDIHGCNASYSDISMGGSGVGVFSADPAFAAPESGNYRLLPGSPCIDAGTSTGAPGTDKDGIARPWGAGYDLGAYEYYVPTYHTSTSLAAPKSVKVNRSLRLSGTVSPTLASPYAAPGKVTIAMTRKVGKKWKGAGSAKVTLSGGAFTYSFKPSAKGSWRFVATYSGGVVGPTTYLSSRSGVKGVTVK